MACRIPVFSITCRPARTAQLHTIIMSGHFVPIFPVVLLLSLSSFVSAGDWTSWRGNTYDGRTQEQNLPVEWKATGEETKNIVWKTDLPPWGRSTPIILGDSVFLTSHDEANGDLLVLRIEKNTGKIVWTRKAGNAKTPRQEDRKGMREWQKFHAYHNLASPSVCGDGESVTAVFGNGDVVAFDRDGNELWHKNLQEEYGEFLIWWGYANSPFLLDDMVIVAVMHDRLDGIEGREETKSYLVAFDKKTGREVWKTDRTTEAPNESSDAYTTPVLWNHEGRREMVIFGADTLDAYDPASGKRLWWIGNGLEGGRTVPMPVPNEKAGIVFGVRGKREPLFAAKPRGLGEQPGSAILWDHNKNVPDVSSVVCTESLLFFVDDGGVATCIDAVQGDVKWSRRLVAGTYFPSLLLAEKDGNLYFLNNDGWCTIVKAGETFEKIAENKIDDAFLSSPVVSDGRIFLRGMRTLYCIGTE